MPAKSTSSRNTAKSAPKPAHAAAAKPRANAVRMSKLEAKRLETFKALTKKFGGRCSFAAFDR
jgi:hypothetical protein